MPDLNVKGLVTIEGNVALNNIVRRFVGTILNKM